MEIRTRCDSSLPGIASRDEGAVALKRAAPEPPEATRERRRRRSSLRAMVCTLVVFAGCATASGRAAVCPATVDAMVDLRSLEPAPVVDIRYATSNNFTSAPLPGYEEPRALLRPAAAAALSRVAARLAQSGLGLKVWDAYRPRRASEAMVEWARRTGNEWVIEQGYVAPESGHNRGSTIDLTLVRLDSGEELDMGTPYDHFTEAAHTANASGLVLQNRMRLVEAMKAEGWENYPLEWWHFSRPADGGFMDVPLACFP